MNKRGEFDCHCPLMGTGLNQHQSECDKRQKKPKHAKTCYPECYIKRNKKPKNEKAQKNGQKRNGNMKKVIDLVNEGMRVKDIAINLDISPGTVSRYKFRASMNGLINNEV